MGQGLAGQDHLREVIEPKLARLEPNETRSGSGGPKLHGLRLGRPKLDGLGQRRPWLKKLSTDNDTKSSEASTTRWDA